MVNIYIFLISSKIYFILFLTYIRNIISVSLGNDKILYRYDKTMAFI